MAIPQKQIYTEIDYYTLPEDVRAELIDGQIYYQAAPSRIHQKILGKIHQKIANYIVEPDISVICDPNKLTERGCTGAPDWIIEIISPGNSSHDYVRKLNLYAGAGVREYWIVNPINRTVLVYYLEESKFEVSSYTFQDKIKVNIYDDFWINFMEINP